MKDNPETKRKDITNLHQYILTLTTQVSQYQTVLTMAQLSYLQLYNFRKGGSSYPMFLRIMTQEWGYYTVHSENISLHAA
jgi:hypothetical protein